MINALITGGAGYIGSNLADRLMAEGYQVWVVDNLSQGKLSNIQHHLRDSRFRFEQGSILDEELMERVIAQVDVVYHLAAVVGVKYVVENLLQSIITNVRGTEVVLSLAHKHGVRTVIASSSEVYGKFDQVPWSEDSDRLLGPVGIKRWAYADSKALDEYLALAYHGLGSPVSIVRYFNSYGPRLDAKGYGSVVAKFITQALQGKPLTVFDDGLQTRSFTYVTDTVEGTYLAGTRAEALGRYFNIGNGRETSILELAHMIRNSVGSSSEIVFVPYEDAFGDRFEDMRRRVPDVRLAAQALGFEAQVPLEEGLERTLEWFRETHYLANPQGVNR